MRLREEPELRNASSAPNATIKWYSHAFHPMGLGWYLVLRLDSHTFGTLL